MLRLAAFGPAETGRTVGLPSLHLDHAIIDVQPETVDEPFAKLAERQAVAHRQRPRADEAFPARAQRQPFDRTSRRVRPVEHPHALAVLGRGFEHIEKRRDEGVDSAADVLQVDQDRVERAHRLAARAPHLAIEAEHRNLVDRIGEVVGLHHIVLLVAAKAMLRAESGGDVHASADQCVDAVREVARDRCGVSE
jgi:hypothetical protein